MRGENLQTSSLEFKIMQRDHSYHIWPRDLDFSTAFHAVEDFALRRGVKWYDEKHQKYSITLNRYESAHPNSFSEFLNVLKRADRFEWFRCTMPFQDSKGKGGITFIVEYHPHCIEIMINGADDDVVVAAHNFIRDEWKLSNPPLFFPQEGRARNLQATVFLGKHFDSESAEPARKLRQFMELLRFDVEEAEEYRALPIPAKVKALIRRQDIYVGLVTGQRDHSWLIAEPAFAQGLPRHVIMVVEEGAGFNPTIQGRDYEQILFPPQFVEKTFIKLLQEFRSLGISGL
jgi:hypothetical protein